MRLILIRYKILICFLPFLSLFIFGELKRREVNDMELRHIKYFIAVAEVLNFSRAAERLNISLPPLTRQIRELEQNVVTPLFYRSKLQL